MFQVVSVFFLTILTFILVSVGLDYFAFEARKKYHREYMRRWRKKRLREELKALREWRKQAIRVKGMENYLITKR